jgi:hypothetical protein
MDIWNVNFFYNYSGLFHHNDHHIQLFTEISPLISSYGMIDSFFRLNRIVRKPHLIDTQRFMQTERRKQPDRRGFPTRPFSKYIFKGRRRHARRKEEDKNYYVDRYDAKYLALVLSILVLCVFDAYFTLKIILYGGKELNPLMIKFLDRFPEMSLFMKYLVTVISLVILLVHKNFILFDKVKADFFLYVIFSLYFFLVLYEAFFLFLHPV